MGRHSASDDDEDGAATTAEVADPATISGRHARLDAPPSPRPPDPAAAPAPTPAAAPAGRGNQSTAADLELLRRHSDVRARVIAAVVVPFVLYTAVLYLIGSIGVYLIWVWIPLVTAGVVAGSILDTEHRRRTSTSDGD
jgi:hypothetical protein